MPKLPRGEKLHKECPICNEDFQCYTYDYERRKYCSVRCKANGTRDQVTITCKQCGKAKTVCVSRSSEQYCSKKCEGNARTIPLKAKIIKHKVVIGDCWIWQGNKNPKGYGCTHLPKGEKILAHRASYIAFCGPIPKGKFVCHICDTPSCVNPKHLFIATAQENTDDMIKKGRNYLRIPKEEIDSMRELYETGKYTKSQIARKYKHCGNYVSRILKGEARNTY